MATEENLQQLGFDELISMSPFNLHFSQKQEQQIGMDEHLNNVRIWEDAVRLNLMPHNSKVTDLTEEIKVQVLKTMESEQK